MENYERTELLEQCGQVTLVDSWGCNDVTSALSGLKNFVVPSVRASPLDTDNPRWRGSRDSRVQSCNWNDVHIGGEYASGNERSLVWREIDTAFENRILMDRCG